MTVNKKLARLIAPVVGSKTSKVAVAFVPDEGALPYKVNDDGSSAIQEEALAGETERERFAVESDEGKRVSFSGV